MATAAHNGQHDLFQRGAGAVAEPPAPDCAVWKVRRDCVRKPCKVRVDRAVRRMPLQINDLLEHAVVAALGRESKEL